MISFTHIKKLTVRRRPHFCIIIGNRSVDTKEERVSAAAIIGGDLHWRKIGKEIDACI